MSRNSFYIQYLLNDNPEYEKFYVERKIQGIAIYLLLLQTTFIM